MLLENESGNLLLSPNGMFKSRTVHRLWRSGRLRLRRGLTLVAFSEHGVEVASFQLQRMDTAENETSLEDAAENETSREELAAGDMIVAPDGKSKVHLLCAEELVVADAHDNVVWCTELNRLCCFEWRRLPTRLKRQLITEGIDSEVWSAIRDEEAAPRSLKHLVHYALRRRREMTYWVWQCSLVTTDWSI